MIRHSHNVIEYPDTFPCPRIEGYGVTYDRLVEDTKMQSGWTRRRRLEPYTFRDVRLSFLMNSQTFWAFHAFVHANLNRYVAINLVTDRVTGLTRKEQVMFTSNMSYQYSSWNLIEANMTASVVVHADGEVIPQPSTPGFDSQVGGDGSVGSGDGQSGTDPAGTINLNNPPREPFDAVVSGRWSVTFRTSQSDDHTGSVVVVANSAVRLWVASNVSSSPIALTERQGTSVSVSWSQGLTLGQMASLASDTRYALIVEPVAAANVNISVLFR